MDRIVLWDAHAHPVSYLYVADVSPHGIELIAIGVRVGQFTWCSILLLGTNWAWSFTFRGCLSQSICEYIYIYIYFCFICAGPGAATAMIGCVGSSMAASLSHFSTESGFIATSFINGPLLKVKLATHPMGPLLHRLSVSLRSHLKGSPGFSPCALNGACDWRSFHAIVFWDAPGAQHADFLERLLIPLCAVFQGQDHYNTHCLSVVTLAQADVFLLKNNVSKSDVESSPSQALQSTLWLGSLSLTFILSVLFLEVYVLVHVFP